MKFTHYLLINFKIGVIPSQTGAKQIYVELFRKSSLLASKRLKSKIYWLLIIFSIWMIAFVIAELIPFFSDLLSIVSSITSIHFTYSLSGMRILNFINIKS